MYLGNKKISIGAEIKLFDASDFEERRNPANLIPEDMFVTLGAEKVGENEYYFALASQFIGIKIWENNENYDGQLLLSYEASYIQEDANNKNNGVIFQLYYTDGSLSQSGIIPNNSGYGKIQIISHPNKVVSYLLLTYATGSTKSYLKNIVLNKGTTEEPYYKKYLKE